MDELLNPSLLPDLESAEVIELKNMRFKQFAHIEYVIDKEGKYLRVCRPFGDFPVFFIPIKTLEGEYARDLEVIRKNQQKCFPRVYGNTDADDERDNHWTNENCFDNPNTKIAHED